MSKPTIDEVVVVLHTLAVQVDEDCPSEYRTQHLRDALEDAFALVQMYLSNPHTI